MLDGGASAETDYLYGETGEDTISGFAGNDVLNGGPQADLIYGGLGADRIYDEGVITAARVTNGGYDLIDGMEGNDTIYLSIDGQLDEVSGGPGIDTIDLTGRMLANSRCHWRSTRRQARLL